MTMHILRTTSISALAAFAFSPAFADVTAEQVWQNWQTLGTAYGQTYTTGSESRSGDTLKITDMALDMTEGENKVSGVIPEVNFRELGDGRVEITMSDEYLMKMQTVGEMGKMMSNSVNIGQNGLTMIASGSPDAISYDMKADSIVVNALDFIIDGKPREMDIDLNLSKLAAVYQVTPGDLTNTTSTFSAEALSFQAIGQDEEGKGKFDITGQMNNLAGASSSVLPKAVPGADFAAKLMQGMVTEGSFTYDSGNFTLSGNGDDGKTTTIDSRSNGGSLNISMDKDRIAYGAAGKAVQLKASGTAIPFPEVTAAYDEAGFNLLMPISKSDEAKDFALETRLQGLTVSDMLWTMIDPGATLPRDPATLIVSLKGKAKPLADMMAGDPTAMIGGKPPFEVEKLDISALQLTVAGAEFKGDGALAFDNSQPPMLGGVAPMPTGKLNLSLTGANGLLGKLQALGLVDQQITMTFGMMSGMLAKPGPTPDSLISEVEFKEGGQILTNGNPLPF